MWQGNFFLNSSVCEQLNIKQWTVDFSWLVQKGQIQSKQSHKLKNNLFIASSLYE